MPENRPVRFGPGVVGKGPARHGLAPRQRPTGTGRAGKLRAYVESLGKGYVFTVPTSFIVTCADGTRTVKTLAGRVPAGGWSQRSCGAGCKGHRWYEWVAAGIVEIGYAVDPAHRRRGYARAGLEALLRRATNEPQVGTVRVTISPDNLASYELASQHGFIEVGQQWDDEDGLEIVYELAAGRL